MTYRELQGKDRRQDKRYGYSGDAIVLSADTGATRPAQLVNLSVGGCLLKLTSSEGLSHRETDLATSSLVSRARSGLEANAIVELLLHVGRLPLLATGTVKRCSEDGLVGLAFQGLSEWGRGDLQKLFSSLEVLPN
jgi:PilZ domain